MNAKKCKKLRKEAKSLATKLGVQTLSDGWGGPCSHAPGTFKAIYKQLKKEAK